MNKELYETLKKLKTHIARNNDCLLSVREMRILLKYVTALEKEITDK